MPEGLEAEIWRRSMQPLVGRRISAVTFDERVVDPGVSGAVGERIESVRRHGKVVLVDTTGSVIGLRFGMTGRLVVDGVAPIASLEYASRRDDAAWDRLLLHTDDPVVPALRLNDPRRLGRVELEPDLSGLGPDVFDVDTAAVRRAIGGRRAPIKSALLDQSVIAGIGNLCADEVLFAAGVAPSTPSDALRAEDTRAIASAIRRRLPAMLVAGGSTEGVLDPARRRELGPCPRRGCAGFLRSSTIAGRTAVWCPDHQPGVIPGVVPGVVGERGGARGESRLLAD